jgi:gamma-glutamylcyclotransferase (GGCT)/AIG2-like uncharacterized protein YtfP
VTLAQLFVYGTLRPEASDLLGRRARDRLARESTLIGAAATSGRLYDLGQYPGLWAGGSGRNEVTGCVIKLAKPSLTFAWLDQYEGNEYARQRRPVALESGGSMVAWVYMLRRKPAARVIDNGDWLDLTGGRSSALTHRASSQPRRRHRSRI